MKKLGYIGLLLCFCLNAFSQRAQNEADLDALYAAIQKMPSYKKLLRGNGTYEQLYSDIKQRIQDSDEKQTFKQLSRLVSAINDNHLGFYRTPDSSLKTVYVSLPLNTDSLRKQLQQKDRNEIEGIYHANRNEFGLYVKGDGNYQIVTLDKGILMAEIFRTPYGGYDLLLYSGKPVPYRLIKNTRLVNGALLGMPFVKDTGKRFSILEKGAGNFEYKMLDEQTGYLRLSSFSSQNDNIKASEEFFGTLVDKMPSKYIIVDLRNNPGGGYKTSQKFINLLKKYKGEIYILQNAETISNAEQFIIELRSLKNVVTLGEQTKGMITFGSNYGKKVLLPSGRFTFSPTDMNGLDKELVYESKGVDPMVALAIFHRDWIEQTLDFIRTKHKE